MLTVLLLLSALFLAYTNGSNDNLKGVATLYGSGTTSYNTALAIATIATFLGSVCAIFLAQELVSSFSGKGLVPQQIAEMPVFLLAVGVGAGSTVFLATLLGFPISTTHSLVGGLLGAGIMAVGLEVNFNALGTTFLLPLLISPLIAVALAALVYRLFSRGRDAMGITKESCICVGKEKQLIPLRVLAYGNDSSPSSTIDMDVTGNARIMLADTADCVERYTDRVWGITVQRLLDFAHIISGATVSFARGLNDTPKIAGLLVATQAVSIRFGMIAIATGIAIGGIMNARRVTETMSHKITSISHGQGFSANLVTGFLVIVASKFGVPVSTTHVSVGSIFGIGMVSNNQNDRVIASIVLSWVITLPLAMILSALTYTMVS